MASKIKLASLQTTDDVNTTAKKNVKGRTEIANLDLAKNVQVCKYQLVNQLAQYPFTAQWLVGKYELMTKTKDIEVDNVETDGNSAVDNLNEIKSKLFALKQNEAKNNADHHFDALKQKLAFATEQFPFAFDDLVQLVDTFMCAYQALKSSVPVKNDCIVKRLNIVNRHKHCSINHGCCLSPDPVSEQAIASLVTAESKWLDARKQLATANSGLVLFIANQYKGGFMEFEDLVQEGQTGLLKAVDKFDYRLGFQFSTYASYWIRQAISRSLTRSERVVRLPFGQMSAISKVYRAKDDFIMRHGHEPTRQELAEFSELSLEEINNVLAISQNVVPLEPADEDDDEAVAPINFLEQNSYQHAFNKMADSELHDLIQDAISGLSEREAQVICSRFGMNHDDEMTFQEIGAQLNLTRERVRQIQVAALNKIKNSYGEELMSFL